MKVVYLQVINLTILVGLEFLHIAFELLAFSFSVTLFLLRRR